MLDSKCAERVLGFSVCIRALAIFFPAIVIAAPVYADAVQSHKVEHAEAHLKSSINFPDSVCEVPGASQKKLLGLKRSCLASLASIDKLRVKQDFSFVDVRTPAEYDRYHIAGAINIPLHALKTKEFLKKLSVVLVNDGHSVAVLENACVELKQSGFNKVSVLEGGLYSWRANKRPLEGDLAAQVVLNRITAEELIDVRSNSNFYVIDFSEKSNLKGLNSWLPTKIIRLKKKGDSVENIVSAVARQSKINSLGMPILIADDNEAYERIDARLQKSSVSLVLLRLDGGVKKYREHVARQLAIWDEQKKPRRYEACRG